MTNITETEQCPACGVYNPLGMPCDCTAAVMESEGGPVEPPYGEAREARDIEDEQGEEWRDVDNSNTHSG